MMTDQKMQIFRQNLLKLQGELQSDVFSLEDEVSHRSDGKSVGNLSDDSVEDRAERGFDNSSEELTMALTGNSAERVLEIRAALGRIQEGTFGHCTDCGREISPGRLEAAPYLPQCIECAREAQRGEVATAGNL